MCNYWRRKQRVLLQIIHYPPNVEVRPKSTPQELRQAYSEAQFYFQGSRVEGLPNVFCEAMLCECIPIGRNVLVFPTP